MIRVRRAEPRDDARVGDILVEGYLAGYARKMPEVVLSEKRLAYLRDVAQKRARGIVLVLEKDERVVGTVTLWPPGDPESEAWIPQACDLRQLVVDPALHGQGLAKPLLDEAERIAREEMRVPAVCLHVRRGNKGVAALYMNRGYLRDPSGDMDLPEVQLDAYVLRL